MRQENYLIALFNKELLDLRVPFQRTEDGKGRTLTRALEWNLQFCLMEYLFDRRGQVRKVFLKSKNRTALIDGCVVCKGHTTAVVNVGLQTKEAFHLHGYLERHIRTLHRGILAHVLVLPIFRSTLFILFSWRAVLIIENRSLITTRLRSAVAHTPPLASGSSGNSTNFPTFSSDVSRSRTL